MSPDERWLAVDPGETVGWSLWQGNDLIESGQTPLWEFGDCVYKAVFTDGPSEEDELMGGEHDLVTLFRGICRIVCEDWRLYPWELKAGTLAWDQCRTARLIGALTLIARHGDLEFTLQPAKIKERAEAAGAEAFFVRPIHENRHQNDSMRHAIYWLAIQRGAAAIEEAVDGHITDAN